MFQTTYIGFSLIFVYFISHFILLFVTSFVLLQLRSEFMFCTMFSSLWENALYMPGNNNKIYHLSQVCSSTCICHPPLSPFFKLSLKTFPQKSFSDSPVCVLLCLCNSSDRVNLFPQNSQSQTKGLSPVCHLKCALR